MGGVCTNCGSQDADRFTGATGDGPALLRGASAGSTAAGPDLGAPWVPSYVGSLPGGSFPQCFRAALVTSWLEHLGHIAQLLWHQFSHL